MSKTIIVSNRLPLKMSFENGKLSTSSSEGGLATGMKSIHADSKDSLWIGWTGLAQEDLTKKDLPEINKQVKKEKCAAVSLSNKDIELFYAGFCNNTIWPLFHYFGEYTIIKEKYWDSYIEVNKKYADVVLKNVKDGDTVWIHDYHLFLLPQMLREINPKLSIGFFLHIPFPSFEMFRTLPWRKELLEGIIGADLIGFHTYDYKRHFMSSVKRILGKETSFNQIYLNNRTVNVDAFPMGIDFDKFNKSSKKHLSKTLSEKSTLEQEIYKYLLLSPEVKLVLSIDRLDYTKGIAKRLRAFEEFLDKNPKYVNKVTLIMLTVPSRSDIEQYQLMKSEVDELVGAINAKYSNINWRPIWYFFRSLDFENLVALYTAADIALITPVRDGMNLVAKEYVASCYDKKGVLILSEMTGASKEMSEALIVNPYSYKDVNRALKQALEMPEDEQIERNDILQQRLKKYDVENWANKFMNSLNTASKVKIISKTKSVNSSIRAEIENAYKQAKKRIIFLDYDGTLVNFTNNPDLAKPDMELYKLLDELSKDKANKLVIISGRKRKDLDKWFANKDYCLIAEHGAWIKELGSDWLQKEILNNEWKDILRPIMDFYVDRTVGSNIEEKDYSLVWHYRNADPELASLNSNELRNELSTLAINHKLEVLDGSNIVEVKCANINKGEAANFLISSDKYDFITCIGDDLTDEYMFKLMPKESISIKIGRSNSLAKYNLNSVEDLRDFLYSLAKE